MIENEKLADQRPPLCQYGVVVCKTIADLTNEVGATLPAGWRPIGGVTQNKDGNYMQSMVKYGF